MTEMTAARCIVECLKAQLFGCAEALTSLIDLATISWEW